MTNPPSQFSPSNAQEQRWRCLLEIALPGPLDNEVLVLTAIRQAFQAAGVPTAYQERLRAALVEAVVQAGERNRQQQPVFPVLIRLLTPQRPAPAQSEPGSDHPTGPSPPPSS